jgi:hypothetical protein
MWVEQSHKQVKHVLGWSSDQVRSGVAMRRHWQLVCCAFSFCWWAYGRLPTDEPAESGNDPSTDSAESRKDEVRSKNLLAASANGAPRVLCAELASG